MYTKILLTTTLTMGMTSLSWTFAGNTPLEIGKSQVETASLSLEPIVLGDKTISLNEKKEDVIIVDNLPKYAHLDFVGQLNEETYENMMYLLTQKKKDGFFYGDEQKAEDYIHFIYEIGHEYGINPVLLMAIQLLETGYFSSSVFKDLNNPGGLQGAISKQGVHLPEIGAVVVANKGCDTGYGYYKYETKESGIRHQAQILNSYKNKGIVSLKDVGNRYNGTKKWFDDATWFLEQIQPDIRI